jgi:predicted membrane chloride channel (bestrophin family)
VKQQQQQQQEKPKTKPMATKITGAVVKQRGKPTSAAVAGPQASATATPAAATPHNSDSDDQQQQCYTWEELERIEQKRRAILTRVEDPFWKILAYWDGTVLKCLVRDSLLWITLLLFAAIRLQNRYSTSTVPKEIGEITNANTTLIGGFLSFFLVFYVNQSHKRYFDLYQASMACKGRVFDVATLAAAYLDRTSASRLVRYMNAAHVAGYVGLSATYPSRSFFTRLNADLGLLSAAELERMDRIDLDVGGAGHRELVAWCMREVHALHRSGAIDGEMAKQLREQVLQLRANFGQLYDAQDLPIPFFYVHFICLLASMYLPLFAISQGYRVGVGDVYWAADVIAGLIVLLQAIFVQGLRILGQNMSDPYGDDQVREEGIKMK